VEPPDGVEGVEASGLEPLQQTDCTGATRAQVRDDVRRLRRLPIVKNPYNTEQPDRSH
jgi:hypothetical protein